MKQRVAIIGTGISGLTCGYLLHDKCDLTVYESNNYIGGHTATKRVSVDSQDYDIDTGFIVFNDWTYPNFIKLMNQLGVAQQATEMSFSVRADKANLEYNGNNLNTLFAQRSNILSLRFWRIVKDIVAFNKACKRAVATKLNTENMTLYSYIQELGLSNDFANYYILPMCAAIWSASLEQTKQFPLTFFLQFFNNHGLLNINDRPQWYTLIGGSHSYIDPITAGFKDSIQLNCGVQSVAIDKTDSTSGTNCYLITDTNGQQQSFDHVIFACHSDQALQMLIEPTPLHKEILGTIPYANNSVVLHTDERQLPQRKLAWASWNYLLSEDENEATAPASVTYNMNILQRIEAQSTFCVTLNNKDAIDPSRILGEYQYAHPQYSQTMVQAQRRRGEICGVDNLHFCGAYWYNGFHEDGVRSALDVCERFGATL